MGYWALIAASDETVQDLELAATRRLDEAWILHGADSYHSAIYLAGFSAEMYLKTTCFFLGGAKPGDPVAGLRDQLRPGKYKPPYTAHYESGHGLEFWLEELLLRRQRLGLPSPPRLFEEVVRELCEDWCVEMRYRPGLATAWDAGRFIIQVEWLARHHAALRR